MERTTFQPSRAAPAQQASAAAAQQPSNHTGREPAASTVAIALRGPSAEGEDAVAAREAAVGAAALLQQTQQRCRELERELIVRSPHRYRSTGNVWQPTPKQCSEILSCAAPEMIRFFGILGDLPIFSVCQTRAGAHRALP